VDADDVLVEAMRPKSAAEHDLIRGAGRAADATMVAMLQAAVPGATERDVARAGFDAGLAHDAVPFLVALATGPAEDRYAPSTLPTWSSRTLEAGDIWHLDLGGSYGGYVFDVARTTVVGGAPRPEQEAMMEAAIATVEAVLERIEPGRPIGEAVAHGHRVRAAHAPTCRHRDGTTIRTSGTRSAAGSVTSGCTRTSADRSSAACTWPWRRSSRARGTGSRCSSRTCWSATTRWSCSRPLRPARGPPADKERRVSMDRPADWTSHPLSRRRLLRHGGQALGVLAGGGLLAACGEESTTTGTVGGGTTAAGTTAAETAGSASTAAAAGFPVPTAAEIAAASGDVPVLGWPYYESAANLPSGVTSKWAYLTTNEDTLTKTAHPGSSRP
jgi:hypothetical protein